MVALASVVLLVRVSSHVPRGHRFDSLSGDMPGLQVQSPEGVHVGVGGNPSMFLSFSLSLINKKIYSWASVKSTVMI